MVDFWIIGKIGKSRLELRECLSTVALLKMNFPQQESPVTVPGSPPEKALEVGLAARQVASIPGGLGSLKLGVSPLAFEFFNGCRLTLLSLGRHFFDRRPRQGNGPASGQQYNRDEQKLICPCRVFVASHDKLRNVGRSRSMTTASA